MLSDPLSPVHWKHECLIFWGVLSRSSDRHLATHQHTIHGSRFFFFIHGLQQFEIVFSLKSHPRSNNYPRTTGFSECPCFYLHLFMFTCLARAQRKHAVSQPHLPPLSLSISWSNSPISLAGQMYCNYTELTSALHLIVKLINCTIKVELINCLWFW